MEKIGRFAVLRRLGGGGFGEVWLGHDDLIDRDVAIKVFNPKDENLIAIATSTDAEGLDILRARFLNEARILGSLEGNTHVVNVLDYGELEDGSPYYVMPYLPRSLADLIGKDIFDASALAELPEADRPSALPLSDSLRYIEQLLTGLAAAHERGLVHRDIKPSNLMLTEKDELRLVDFGIAKAPDGQHSTVSQLGMGSRNYMAPEQRESAKHVDARADVYAVGVVAYRCLTGKLPVGRFSDPNVLVPDLNQALNDLIVACLAMEKQDRPKDAAALLQSFVVAREFTATAPESTGTWVSGGDSNLRDELKPLKEQISALLRNNAEITEKDMISLNAMALVAELDEEGLQALIDAEERVQSNTLRPAKNLLRLVDEQIARDQIDLAVLNAAGRSIGWDEERINTLVNQRKPAATSPDGHTQQSPDAGSSKWMASAAAIIIIALVAGGYTWYQTEQEKAAFEQAIQEKIAEENARQVAEEAEAAQQADEQRAWQEAARQDSVTGYEAYLARDNTTTEHREAAASRITALEAAASNQETQRLAALEKAVTQQSVAAWKDFLESGLGKEQDNAYARQVIENLKVAEAQINQVATSQEQKVRDASRSAWEDAKRINTIAAYQKVVNDQTLSDVVRGLAKTQILIMQNDTGTLLNHIKTLPAE